MTPKVNSNLAAITFFAKSHPGDCCCGSNGLPLTPNSIAILGRAQILKTIDHPNLCEYLDIVRGKHGKSCTIGKEFLRKQQFCCLTERTIVVSEYYGTPLCDRKNFSGGNQTYVLRLFYQIAIGLDHVHRSGFVCHNLEPANVLVDSLDNVKLFNYGLFHMTNEGDYVSFPIGSVCLLNNVRFMLYSQILLHVEMSDTCHQNICWVPETTRKVMSGVWDSL